MRFAAGRPNRECGPSFLEIGGLPLPGKKILQPAWLVRAPLGDFLLRADAFPTASGIRNVHVALHVYGR